MSLFVSVVDTVNLFMLSGFYCRNAMYGFHVLSEVAHRFYLMKVMNGNDFHISEYYFQF